MPLVSSFHFQDISGGETGSHHKIFQYKFLWLRLSNLTQDLGNSMGFSYGALFVLCFSAQVLGCYGFLFNLTQGFKLINVVLAATSTFLAVALFYLCSTAQFVTQEVTNRWSNNNNNNNNKYYFYFIKFFLVFTDSKLQFYCNVKYILSRSSELLGVILYINFPFSVFRLNFV